MRCKKLLSLLLALVLALGCVGTAFAATTNPWEDGDTPESNEIFYTATAQVELDCMDSYNYDASSYDSDSGKGIMVFNEPITEIPENAFYSRYDLITVCMPNVITVGEGAFVNCISLETVYMPNVTTVEARAFQSCSSLENVSMPKVQTIGNEAFWACSSLENLYMPKAETLGSDAFVDSLKYIYAPESLAGSLDDYGFYSVTISAPHGRVAISDTDFTAVLDCATYAESEIMVNLTATPDDLYKQNKIEYTYNDGSKDVTTDITTAKYFTMPAANVTVTATFENNGCYLDLDETDATYPIKKDIDQNYTLTVTDSYTDKTKVKLTWNITDIGASRTENKDWDPDTLSWVDGTGSGTTVDTNGAATFTLTNYSSKQVNATASFTAETGFSPTVAYADSTETDITSTTANTSKAVTLGTVVKSDKSVDDTIDHDETITVAITCGTDDFASSNAGTAKYGTYTITLSEPT